MIPKKWCILVATMEHMKKRRRVAEVCGWFISLSSSVCISLRLDEPIRVERDKEDKIFLQHFMTQKLMSSGGSERMAFLTDLSSQAIELITCPVLKSDKIIKAGHSYHLISCSKYI